VDPHESGSEEHDQPEEEEKDVITTAIPVRNGTSSLHDDRLVSKSFKFFMNLQLVLILVLAVFWLYDAVGCLALHG
jgi:hypothetical protein